MSDAPETEVDSEIVVLDCEDSCCAVYVRNREGKEIDGDLVPADFARRLVRERDEARTASILHGNAALELEAERDEAHAERLTLRAQVAELKARFDPPLGESGEEYYCKRDAFTVYITDEVNPAREKCGLAPLDLKTAEECYRILNDFARQWDTK